MITESKYGILGEFFPSICKSLSDLFDVPKTVTLDNNGFPVCTWEVGTKTLTIGQKEFGPIFYWEVLDTTDYANDGVISYEDMIGMDGGDRSDFKKLIDLFIWLHCQGDP